MGIEALELTMVNDNVVAIACIAVLYQLYFARQHGVNNLMSGTEVYAVMELSTLLKRVLAVSI